MRFYLTVKKLSLKREIGSIKIMADSVNVNLIIDVLTILGQIA